MPNENAKFQRFADMINKNAASQCRIIEKQTEQYKKAELLKLKTQNDEELKSRLSYETGKINARYNKHISDIKRESRKALMLHREKLTDEIFEKVKEKLAAFVLTKEYESFLASSLKKLPDSLNLKEGERAMVFVREGDLEIIKALAEKTEFIGEVKPSAEILLGGIIAENESGTLRCNDSLGSRLALEKEEFIKRSNLKIEN